MQLIITSIADNGVDKAMDFKVAYSKVVTNQVIATYNQGELKKYPKEGDKSLKAQIQQVVFKKLGSYS